MHPEVLSRASIERVDLERVEFMDCAGLRVLVQWAGDDGGRGPKRLLVTPGPRQVQRLVELTQANRLLTVISPRLHLRPAA